MQIVPFTTEIALRIEELFPGNRPIPTRLWAILDGAIQGRILVDEPSHPTFALVQDLTEGTAHLGGVMTPAILYDALTIARSYQDIVETLVSEAIAAPLTRGVAELGTETEEAHQRKGLATVISAYVIRECEAMGYRAFWNAAQQNVASVALARRLGFQTEQPFTVLAWSATHAVDDVNITPDMK